VVVVTPSTAEKSDATVANLAALVDSGAVDVVIHSGDISYADGFMPHWDTFVNKVQPIASKVPYMVTPGNHELWYNFSQYKHRWCMPNTHPNDAEGTKGSGDNSKWFGSTCEKKNATVRSF
jgi:hypothetical protein